jgi:hypothetical protein
VLDGLTEVDLARALDGVEGVRVFDASVAILGAELQQRRRSEWYVTDSALAGGTTDWLGTELVWADGPGDGVVIGVPVTMPTASRAGFQM